MNSVGYRHAHCSKDGIEANYFHCPVRGQKPSCDHHEDDTLQSLLSLPVITSEKMTWDTHPPCGNECWGAHGSASSSIYLDTQQYAVGRKWHGLLIPHLAVDIGEPMEVHPSQNTRRPRHAKHLEKSGRYKDVHWSEVASRSKRWFLSKSQLYFKIL